MEEWHFQWLRMDSIFAWLIPSLTLPVQQSGITMSLNLLFSQADIK
jgi:hypothetical protein